MISEPVVIIPIKFLWQNFLKLDFPMQYIITWIIVQFNDNYKIIYRPWTLNSKIKWKNSNIHILNENLTTKLYVLLWRGLNYYKIRHVYFIYLHHTIWNRWTTACLLDIYRNIIKLRFHVITEVPLFSSQIFHNNCLLPLRRKKHHINFN